MSIIKTIFYPQRRLNESAVALSNKAKLSLYKKSSETGIDVGTLEEVYFRGYRAWDPKTGHTPEQSGFNRVNSFIAGGAAHDLDKDLAENKPSDRFIGTDSLVKILKKDTPGEKLLDKSKHISNQQRQKKIIDEESRMFSAKNFGLPRDLVDAVRSVMEGKEFPPKKDEKKEKTLFGKKDGDDKKMKDTKEKPAFGKSDKEPDNDEDDTSKIGTTGEKTKVEVNPETDDDIEDEGKDLKKKKSEKTERAPVKEDRLITAATNLLDRQSNGIRTDARPGVVNGTFNREEFNLPEDLMDAIDQMIIEGLDEAEILNELGKGTLSSYLKKAHTDSNVNYHYSVNYTPGTKRKAEKERKVFNRSLGNQRAVDRLANGTKAVLKKKEAASAPAASSNDSAPASHEEPHKSGGIASALRKRFSKTNEEVGFSEAELDALNAIAQENQLDEISKEVVGKYALKALADRQKQHEKQGGSSDKAYKAGRNLERVKKAGPDRDYGESDKNHAERIDRLTRRRDTARADEKEATRKGNNRSVGLYRAGRRLAKEESEQIDELSVKTLKNYRDKSEVDRDKKYNEMDDQARKGDQKWHKTARKIDNRITGQYRATDALVRKTGSVDGVKEEAINEVTRDNISAYVKSAIDGVAYHAHKAAHAKTFDDSLKHIERQSTHSKKITSAIERVLKGEE